MDQEKARELAKAALAQGQVLIIVSGQATVVGADPSVQVIRDD